MVAIANRLTIFFSSSLCASPLFFSWLARVDEKIVVLLPYLNYITNIFVNTIFLWIKNFFRNFFSAE